MAASAKQIEIAAELDANGGDGLAYISCQRKTRYPQFKDAFVEACRITPRKKATFRVRIYVCRRCAGFHLAHIECNPENGKPKSKPSKEGKSALAVLKEHQIGQMKRIMQLQEELKIAKAKTVDPCPCWWCRAGRRVAKSFRMAG